MATDSSSNYEAIAAFLPIPASLFRGTVSCSCSQAWTKNVQALGRNTPTSRLTEQILQTWLKVIQAVGTWVCENGSSSFFAQSSSSFAQPGGMRGVSHQFRTTASAVSKKPPVAQHVFSEHSRQMDCVDWPSSALQHVSKALALQLWCISPC